MKKILFGDIRDAGAIGWGNSVGRGISILMERTGINTAEHSLRKHPFLHALRRWGRSGRFLRAKGPQRRRARRNGCFRRRCQYNIGLVLSNERGNIFPYTRTRRTRTRPIFSHLDRVSLANKEFTLWPKQTCLLRYKSGCSQINYPPGQC